VQAARRPLASHAARSLRQPPGRPAASPRPQVCYKVPTGEGFAFELNNKVPHRVSNNGATDRVHLVVDISEAPRHRVALEPGAVCHYDVNKGLFCGPPGASAAAAAPQPEPPQAAPVPVPARGTVPAAARAPGAAFAALAQPAGAGAQGPQEQEPVAAEARLEALQQLQLDSQRLLLQQERLLAQQQQQLLHSLQFAQQQAGGAEGLQGQLAAAESTAGLLRQAAALSGR
jgi:hypothetical protein